MNRKIKILVINNLVIFILTGIIYVFIEVLGTSSFSTSMIDKYRFNPVPRTVYEKMKFKPPVKCETEEKVYLEPIKKLSLIGASSVWMFLVGGLAGLCLYLLYNAFKNKFNLFFLCLTGALIITVLEFLSGLLLNGWLRLFIWDYTKKFLDLWGQICLGHFVTYVFIISPLAFWLFNFIKSQYPENEMRITSLKKHYLRLFLPASKNLEYIEKKIYVNFDGKK